MIPKSGNRFSDKIMRKKHMATGWATGSLVMALMLAGCASAPFGNQPSSTGSTPEGMAGRWMLSAPNAPACGMNFGGTAGAREGRVAPEGGCPERFFTSRRWTLRQNALTISDDDSNALAQFSFAGDRFEGKSNAGTPLTLER